MAKILCSVTLTLFLSISLSAQQTMGLFLNDVQASMGYTLFGNNETSYLIDNCGFVVNSWESEYDPGSSMYLLNNGNLLRTARINGSFNAGGQGGRFELFSWEGDLIWAYNYADANHHSHHDIAPLPNGNFLAIAWDQYSPSEAEAAGRLAPGPVWSEKIIELEILDNNQANIVWEWRVWDHLIQDVDSNKPNYGVINEHPELININFPSGPVADWLHFNAIDYNEELDQIAISSRNSNEIWIIDHSTNTLQAAGHTDGQAAMGGDILYRFGNPTAYGRGDSNDQLLFRQHNVQWIPEGFPYGGQLMVFNNDYIQTDASNIEIWEPPLIEGSFQYAIGEAAAFGPLSTSYSYANDSLYSRNQSGVQMQANGNLLICQTDGGFVFEINQSEELVWKYINPVNSSGGPGIQGGTPQFNGIFRAERYALDHPAFDGRTIIPGDPIELLPLDNNCELFTAIEDITKETTSNFRINNNISSNLIRIERTDQSITNKASLSIYNLSGQRLITMKINKPQEEVNISSYPSGMYLLVLEGPNLRELIRIIKI